MEIRTFIPMQPPTITDQMHRMTVINGKAVQYKQPELQAAREKLRAHLAGHAPEQPLKPPIRCLVKWCFPIKGDHKDGEYRTSRPDTGNLNKMLFDVMTELHYWKDDAHVASEIGEKFWADVPGLYIVVQEIEIHG